MNQNTKLALVIGGIVSAVAGLTTLGVVYARFEQAQKTVKQTTLGDLLREKQNDPPAPVLKGEPGTDGTSCPDEEVSPEKAAALAAEETTTLNLADEPAPELKVVPKKPKSAKKGAPKA